MIFWPSGPYLIISVLEAPVDHVFAYGPKTGPAFLQFFIFGPFRGWSGVGGWGGLVNVLGLRPSRHAL